MSRSNERGVAMVFALFMMLALSLLGTSLIFVSRTETVSSQNYRMMSQARYGAESAIHKAANFLLDNGPGGAYPVPQPGGAVDPYEGFTQSVNGITYNGRPVVLSSVIGNSNYPNETKKETFAAFTTDSFDTSDGRVTFTATATLKSMRKFRDGILGTDSVVQTWEIVGDAVVPGANEARIQVSAILERQPVPVYRYAAFATATGCAALSFRGGALTNSYDSSDIHYNAQGRPMLDANSGNVGTNGNLTEVGNTTTINGTLSTPRSGVGTCTANNVTAQTVSGGATVTGGLNQLPQEVVFPTPPPPVPVPPTTSLQFPQDPCPASIGCTSSSGTVTIHPPSTTTPVVLGNVSLNANAVLHLGAGTYNVNSFTMNGNSQIVIDSGPVIFNVKGEGQSTPITINGGGIVNSTFKPSDLQFLYGGTNEIRLNGGEKSAALFYAPRATASINGQADLYGAIVVNTLTQSGGGEIHYDRNLDNLANTVGNPWMSSFNWSTY